VNATQVSKDAQVCRSTSRRRFLAAGLIAGLVAVLSGLPATAGTSADPEITDPAGDANFVSSVTANQQDTRPVSSDNGDISAVWFETAYTTSKVLDPATGDVVRVEYRPAALVANIRTQAAVRPLSPWANLRFKIQAQVPACNASFELLVTSSSAVAELRPAVVGQTCDGSTIAISSVEPKFEGNLSTITFPLTHGTIPKFITPGATLSQPAAHVFPGVGVGPASPVALDQTVSGRSFTVGQDVPADFDCASDPGHTDCQP